MFFVWFFYKLDIQHPTEVCFWSISRIRKDRGRKIIIKCTCRNIIKYLKIVSMITHDMHLYVTLRQCSSCQNNKGSVVQILHNNVGSQYAEFSSRLAVKEEYITELCIMPQWNSVNLKPSPYQRFLNLPVLWRNYETHFISLWACIKYPALFSIALLFRSSPTMRRTVRMRWCRKYLIIPPFQDLWSGSVRLFLGMSVFPMFHKQH